MAANTNSEDLWLSMEVENEDLSQQGSRKSIVRFNCFHDIMLLREVNAQNPFGHEHTKHTWDCVATNLRTYMPEVTSRTCKERTMRLLKFFKARDMISLRRSGTGEQYAEKEQLLQELKDLEEEGAVEPVNIVKPIKARKKEANAAELRTRASTSLVGTPSTSEDDADEQNQMKSTCTCGRSSAQKRASSCSALADYLAKKQAAEIVSMDKDREVRLAELEIEKRRVTIDERKIEIEQRKLELEAERWREDKQDRRDRWREEKEERREQRKMLMDLIKSSKKD